MVLDFILEGGKSSSEHNLMGGFSIGAGCAQESHSLAVMAIRRLNGNLVDGCGNYYFPEQEYQLHYVSIIPC